MGRHRSRRGRDQEARAPGDDRARRRPFAERDGQGGCRRPGRVRAHRHPREQRRRAGQPRQDARRGAARGAVGHRPRHEPQGHVHHLAGRCSLDARAPGARAHHQHVLAMGQEGRRAPRGLLLVEVRDHRFHAVPGPGAGARGNHRERDLSERRRDGAARSHGAQAGRELRPEAARGPHQTDRRGDAAGPDRQAERRGRGGRVPRGRRCRVHHRSVDQRDRRRCDALITRTVPRPRPFADELTTVACTVVLLAVAFCVVYPLLLVVLESFQVAPPGQPARYGLDGWRAAFAEPLLRAALVNTLKVTVARQAISLALALLIAWLIARTDLPGRDGIEFAFWAAFFLPTLTVTLSWILLLDPDYGLITTGLVGLGLAARWPFDVYSFWGIVWIHIITGSLTVKVILLTPAFRNMNAAFEEASRVAGAGTFRTALSITIPVMAPVVLSVLLLGTMVSLQTFEVEQVLGVPFRLDRKSVV